MGLRKMVYDELIRKRYMPYAEIEELVRNWGYRTSNLERRLRPSESDKVIAVKATEPPRHIVGYKYIGTDQPTIQIQQFNQGAMKF
jgi:hypothetical protein